MESQESFEELEQRYSGFSHKNKQRIKGLTEKEIRFSHAYVANDCNCSAACREVGIKQRHGMQTKAKPQVIDYIAYLKEQRRVQMESQLSLTWHYKAKQLKDIIEFYIDKPQAQIKAIEELNKMQGHYAPVKTENYHGLTDDVNDALGIANKKVEIKKF